jgi:hypothetical protein
LDGPAAQLALWDRTDDRLTVKSVRAAKQSRPSAPPAFEPILRSLQTGVTRMQTLTSSGAVLDEHHHQALRTLRDHLNKLLGEY